MELQIQVIEEVELPNYIETIWSGGFSHEQEAPLLAKYRVDLDTPIGKLAFFYEIRDQPGLPCVGDYYEDQVYEALMKLLSPIRKEKARTQAYNYVQDQISDAVSEVFMGSELSFPIILTVSE